MGARRRAAPTNGRARGAWPPARREGAAGGSGFGRHLVAEEPSGAGGTRRRGLDSDIGAGPGANPAVLGGCPGLDGSGEAAPGRAGAAPPWGNRHRA